MVWARTPQTYMLAHQSITLQRICSWWKRTRLPKNICKCTPRYAPLQWCGKPPFELLDLSDIDSPVSPRRFFHHVRPAGFWAPSVLGRRPLKLWWRCCCARRSLARDAAKWRETRLQVHSHKTIVGIGLARSWVYAFTLFWCYSCTMMTLNNSWLKAKDSPLDLFNTA